MAFQVGDIIDGRYRLVSERGRGTFGEVWQAWDETLDMEVAIKIYIALDSRGIDEFKSEYKTTYSLTHPNLLHADHFEVVEKRPYLVMPYCPESAVELVGKITEEEAWRFIRDVSSGLAYLHSKNIIHRDIKPDNVLRDGEGNFLISDFGVSVKMRSTLRKNSVRDLSESTTQGTIGYMGPEMFTADPSAVKATDIWALGASLWELLVGELPFFGQGGGMLMSGAEIPVLKGQWSESLKVVVESCLAKDPWARPKADQLASYAQTVIDDPTSVHVLAVSLSDHALSLTEGETSRLSATVTPVNAKEKGLTWRSSKPSVAAVNQDGVVEAKSVGNAVVSVISKDQQRTDTCQVTVKERIIPVEAIVLNQDTLVLTEEESFSLRAEIRPFNATNKEVEWVSDNADVASVAGDGTVVAHTPGTTVITAYSADRGVGGKCRLTVKPKPVPVSSVSLSQQAVSLEEGESVKLDSFVEPSNATNQAVKWSSDNNAVATVKADGTVLAKAPGVATVSVVSEDQGKTAQCRVEVKEKIYPVESVSLPFNTLTLTEGDSSKLVVRIGPKNATNKEVSWSSDNVSVATVDPDGSVSAVSPGKATIIVRSADLGLTDVCQVSVHKKIIPVRFVSLSEAELLLVEGESATLKASILPEDATNQEVRWSSSDPDIASVDSEGHVLAKSKGKTKIIVQSAGGEDRSKCTVVVKAKPKPKPVPKPSPVERSVAEDNPVAPAEHKKSKGWLWIIAVAAAAGVFIWSPWKDNVSNSGSNPVVKQGEPTTVGLTPGATIEDEALAVTDTVKKLELVEAQEPATKEPVNVSGVTLSKSDLLIEEGKGAQLSATIHPVGADNKSVSWKSNDPSVATVSSKGYVSAKKAGSATITVTTVDGGKIATCLVTVKGKAPVIESANPATAQQSKSNDWTEIKKQADAGDADACAKYASHSYDSGNYDNAHKYALKAGKAKGTTVIVKLRKDGYYDEGVADPGWK